MNRKLLYLARTIIGCYGVLAASIVVLNWILPGGPHAPGLAGLFFIFILPFIVVGLLIRTVILVRNGKTEYMYSLIFHSIAVLALLIVFIWAFIKM